MNSYTIDTSIYSVPDVTDILVDEKIKKYQAFVDRIYILNNLLKPQNANIKLYFYRKDIKSLKKRQGLFTKDKLNEFKKLLCVKYNLYPLLDDLQEFYITLIENLITHGYEKKYEGDEKDYSRYITIESHININTSDIEVINDIECEPPINNLSFLKDYNKKLAIHAFLNRYIYRDSGINKIVLNQEMSSNKIKLNANISNITHQFLIDDIPKTRFIINEQAIEFCRFEENFLRKQYSTIEDAFFQARIDFCNTLDFLDSVEKNIKDYQQTMNDLKEQCFDCEKYKKIADHMKECPNTLYDHLDSLDKLVKYYKDTKDVPINKRRPIMEKYIQKYDDKSTCYKEKKPICRKCCAFLRLCRFRCSGEKKENMFGGKKFNIHLKPYSYGTERNNKDIAALTLRIYFRWDTENIQIGYIGKHL